MEEIKLNVNFDILISKDAFNRSTGAEINLAIKHAVRAIYVKIGEEKARLDNIQWR
jgi:hypothetical protein